MESSNIVMHNIIKMQYMINTIDEVNVFLLKHQLKITLDDVPISLITKIISKDDVNSFLKIFNTAKDKNEFLKKLIPLNNSLSHYLKF
jgi:hypothetical protein